MVLQQAGLVRSIGGAVPSIDPPVVSRYYAQHINVT